MISDKDALARYEQLRQAVARAVDPNLLNRPLIHWMSVNDTYVPRNVLKGTLKQALALDPQRLGRMKGIGLGKLKLLCELFQRILDRETNAPPRAFIRSGSDKCNAPFTEDEWDLLRHNIAHSQFASEPLGTFARTLKDLPSAIWEVPLQHYAGMSLLVLQREPRIGLVKLARIVDCFRHANACLPGGARSNVVTRLTTPKVIKLEQWIVSQQQRLTVAALNEHVIAPLLQQLEQDSDPALAAFVRMRLGQNRPPMTLKEIADQMDVSSQWVQHKLEQAARIMKIRWPDGRIFFAQLRDKLDDAANGPGAGALLDVAGQLFFAARRRRRITALRKLTEQAPA